MKELEAILAYVATLQEALRPFATVRTAAIAHGTTCDIARTDKNALVVAEWVTGGPFLTVADFDRAVVALGVPAEEFAKATKPERVLGWRVKDVTAEGRALKYVVPCGDSFAWSFGSRPMPKEDAEKLRALTVEWHRLAVGRGMRTDWNAKDIRIVRVVRRAKA